MPRARIEHTHIDHTTAASLLRSPSAPAAAAILRLGRDIENRPWWTRHRGSLIIHAGRTFDTQGAEHLARAAGTPRLGQLRLLPRGAIVGVVQSVDVVNSYPSPWARPRGAWERICYWVLEDPRPLPEPIPARGDQSLWTPAAEVLAEIRRQLEGGARS